MIPLQLHEGKGIKFYNGNSIAEFEGGDGAVTSVKLTDGTSLPADACVLGVGEELGRHGLLDVVYGLRDNLRSLLVYQNSFYLYISGSLCLFLSTVQHDQVKQGFFEISKCGIWKIFPSPSPFISSLSLPFHRIHSFKGFWNWNCLFRFTCRSNWIRGRPFRQKCY